MGGGRGRGDVAYVVIVEGGSEEGHEMMRTCACKGEGERGRGRERERERERERDSMRNFYWRYT